MTEFARKLPTAIYLANELDKDVEGIWELLDAGTYKYLGHKIKPLSANSAIELRRAHQSEREGWRYADELEQDRKRLDDLCIKQFYVIGLLNDQLAVKNSGIIKEDKDTQEQCDLFDEYLEEYHDGRTKHSLGAYGYDEQEWEAFQSGWNASKKHFGVFWS